jgi:hypothetical protein
MWHVIGGVKALARLGRLAVVYLKILMLGRGIHSTLQSTQHLISFNCPGKFFSTTIDPHDFLLVFFPSFNLCIEAARRPLFTAAKPRLIQRVKHCSIQSTHEITFNSSFAGQDFVITMQRRTR